jgi:hypothetical protein
VVTRNNGRRVQKRIEPVLLEAGYTPICLNNVFLNDDVTFRILMEIRSAQFTRMTLRVFAEGLSGQSK